MPSLGRGSGTEDEDGETDERVGEGSRLRMFRLRRESSAASMLLCNADEDIGYKLGRQIIREESGGSI